MKTRLKVLGLVCFLLAANWTYSQQQPQWKFHLAFEDDLGQVDTIWFISDSAATYGIDSVFGEIPATIIDTAFQVFFHGSIGGIVDSFKVEALNFTDYFALSIYTINDDEYPITIRWDSSLFNSSQLPHRIRCAEMSSMYFFHSGNICQTFNMLETDMVILPPWWLIGGVEHFPITINMGLGVPCCLNYIGDHNRQSNEFIISPNPAQNNIVVESRSFRIQKVIIYALDGRCMSKTENKNCRNVLTIPVDSFVPGCYIVEIYDKSNQKHYGKFIKN